MVDDTKMLGYKGKNYFPIVKNSDGSITFNQQNYLNESNLKFDYTDEFDFSFSQYSINILGSQVDVTDQLSDYKGRLAFCVIAPSTTSFLVSQPFIIPSRNIEKVDVNFFEISDWSAVIQLYNDKFTFVPSYKYASTDITGTGEFYLLENN